MTQRLAAWIAARLAALALVAGGARARLARLVFPPALRQTVHAIVYDLDPRAVEVFTAQLSLWFAAVFLLSPTGNKPQPVLLWVGWCAAAAVLKLVGVLPTLRGGVPPFWTRHARITGCFLGVGFWSTLSIFLLFISRFQGITWGGYALVACAQAWCAFRLFRGPGL